MQVTEILRQCTIEGNFIKLPSIQLDRYDYLEVKKSLELIGGKWKGGKTQAFVFKENPTDYLSQLCQGEKINLKKEFQFFATPPAIADWLVELAEIKPEYSILEPSAGQGAIINAVHKVFPDKSVDCFELMDLNRSFLEKLSNTNIIGSDFITEHKEHLYDCIIANPPFSKNQDIDHVYEMYGCLSDTGRIVSIMSNHWRNTSGKKEKTFQQFIEDIGADVKDIEEGAFKESGTGISACIIVIDKDTYVQIPPSSISGKVEKNQEQRKPEELFESKDNQKTKLPPKPDESLKKFADSFNSFAYRFSQNEVFVDFLDYVLLVMKWWEPDRDFTYFEKKYGDIYSKFAPMLQLLSIASDNSGEGFRDALGDLFMELVSGGRNGQFFTPDNICEMIGQIVIPEVKTGETVLDPACGSGRMLLAAGKRNRNAFFFGCDNDVTCCKMATVNLLLNTLQGEIALMDSLKMEYTKSWEVSYREYNGGFLPVYRIVEYKEDSVLWKMHINSFTKEKPKANNHNKVSIPIHPIIPSNSGKTQKHIQLQLF